MRSAQEVETLSEVEPTMVSINVNFDFTFEVDQTYVTIPQNSVTTICWNIVAPNLPPDSLVLFDRPAITFLGTSPDVQVQYQTPTQLVVSWTNDEATRGSSFFYRLHMVGKTPTGPDTFRLFAISHDPVIHNEPPSDTGL
jgi:hypothetical protein